MSVASVESPVDAAVVSGRACCRESSVETVICHEDPTWANLSLDDLESPLEVCLPSCFADGMPSPFSAYSVGAQNRAR